MQAKPPRRAESVPTPGLEAAAAEGAPGPAPEPSTSAAAESDGQTRLPDGLPEDVRQSLDELREPGGRARARRWLLVAAIYASTGQLMAPRVSLQLPHLRRNAMEGGGEGVLQVPLGMRKRE